MFNEIEEAIVAALQHERRGLPGDDQEPWYVPAAKIGRQLPTLQGNVSNLLPAVGFAMAEFDVLEDDFSGLGEPRDIEDGVREIRPLRFNLCCHLDVWAEAVDDVNAILQRAIEILVKERDWLKEEEGDYRLLRVRPVTGRTVPTEQVGSKSVFKRQVDYDIDCELLIKTRHTPIEQVIIEEVEWDISEE
jgi:hypothetical protein